MTLEQEQFEEATVTKNVEVTVTQLILIRKKILKFMEDTLNEISKNATLIYPIMDSDAATEKFKALAENDTTSILDLKQKYNSYAQDYFFVENLIEEHNQNAIVEHEGNQQTINQALRFNKLARTLNGQSYFSEQKIYEHLLKNAKSRYVNNGTKMMREEPNFSPSDIELALSDLNKTMDTLSLKIEELNNRTSFNFPNAYKYLDL